MAILTGSNPIGLQNVSQGSSGTYSSVLEDPGTGPKTYQVARVFQPYLAGQKAQEQTWL